MTLLAGTMGVYSVTPAFTARKTDTSELKILEPVQRWDNPHSQNEQQTSVLFFCELNISLSGAPIFILNFELVFAAKT